MSYILEALKKSEQERERGNVPDIKSVHAASSSSSTAGQRSWWPYLLLVVIVINGAIFAIIYFGNDTVSSQKQASLSSGNEHSTVDEVKIGMPQQLETPAKAETSPVKSEVQQTAAVKKPPVENIQQSAPKVTPRVIFSDKLLQRDSTVGNVSEQDSIERQKAREPAKHGVVKKDEAVLPSDLPENVRQQIPSITFEGHVYSTAVARRSVVINGKKMHEGESVGAGLTIKEITPIGAEFEYKGYLFRLDALQDWSYR
jgi:general secretion pathway protein B